MEKDHLASARISSRITLISDKVSQMLATSVTQPLQVDQHESDLDYDQVSTTFRRHTVYNLFIEQMESMTQE